MPRVDTRRVMCLYVAIQVMLFASGCRTNAAFHCQHDDQCRRGDEPGTCAPVGYCSFPDPDCPGGRYDETAGGGLAGTCVGTDAGCFAEIAGGEAHLCVRRSSGTVSCWGRATELQLAGVLLPRQMTPTTIAVSGVKQIAMGDRFTCVRITDDTLRCFGTNTKGQIGNGTMGGTVATPTAPSNLGAVRDADGGLEHACAITSGGAVMCWGNGGDGRLGTGTMADALMPVPATHAGGGSVVDATAIATGDRHSCAVANGNVYCWGRDIEGQLGDGPPALNQASAVQVPLGASAVDVIAGRNHTCARLGDGTAWCWGENTRGQVGDGLVGNRLAPVQVANLPAGQAVTALALGDRHSCALVGGALWCWGDNALGQIANPDDASPHAPAQVDDLGSPFAIAGTKDNTCAIDGTAVRCRGGNTDYQLAKDPRDDLGAQPHPMPTTIAVPCS